jgi:hypothetical protein
VLHCVELKSHAPAAELEDVVSADLPFLPSGP